MSQAKRYNTLKALTERENLDSSYYAAFYLLSADEDLCDRAYDFVSIDGIDFEGLEDSCKYLDGKPQQLLSVAHNLFSWWIETTVSPFDISRLGYPYLELVCDAFFIAADQYIVRTETNENGYPVLTLDKSHYEKTKHFCQSLSQMAIEKGDRTYDDGLEQ